MTDEALTGAGSEVELIDGSLLTPTNSLRGSVVDPSGDPLPGVDLDFALIGVSNRRFGETQGRMIEELQRAGNNSAAAALAEGKNGGAAFLVEIATADYEVSRNHVSPDDRALVDLSFVETLTPGDKIRSIHIFGQTIPGDPTKEGGLSGTELFTYRWNQGLVSFLGNGENVSVIFDDQVVMVGGDEDPSASSTDRAVVERQPNPEAQLDQQISLDADGDNGENPEPGPEEVLDPSFMKLAFKAAVLRAAYDQGFAEGAHAGQELEEEESQHPCAAAESPGDRSKRINRTLEEAGLSDEWGPVITLWWGDPDAGNCEDETVLPAGFIVLLEAQRQGRERCVEEWQEMLRRNAGDAIVSGYLIHFGTSTTGEGDPPSNGWCDPPDNPPTGDEPDPLGGIFGDVHLRTFDGLAYDNQAAGEFLLFDNGSATVQIRTEPWPGSEVASVATAVAVRVGAHTISMHVDDEYWIDGQPGQLVSGVPTEIGGAGFLAWNGGWVVSWPDGSWVRVVKRTGFLLLLVSTPEGTRASGMVGSPDGDRENDLTTRDGIQLASDAEDDFDTFYSTYIDTFRITQDESLFHYDPEEDTTSFTIEGFPVRRASIEDFSDAVATEAMETCEEAGVVEADLVDACAYDVAVTGDIQFAESLYTFQAALPTGSSTAPETPPFPTGSENSVTVGTVSISFGADPLVRVPNTSYQWTCQMEGGSFFANSRFLETSTREIDFRVDYLDSATSGSGVDRFQMNILLNGNHLVWVSNTVEPPPGSIDFLNLENGTLTVRGTAYLNDPIDPGLFPASALPPGTVFQPFSLVVSCDQ